MHSTKIYREPTKELVNLDFCSTQSMAILENIQTPNDQIHPCMVVEDFFCKANTNRDYTKVCSKACSKDCRDTLLRRELSEMQTLLIASMPCFWNARVQPDSLTTKNLERSKCLDLQCYGSMTLQKTNAN